MNLSRISINRWVTFVTIFFIVISPIENIVRIERITYSCGIVMLIIPILYGYRIRINHTISIILLWLYICISSIWSPNNNAFSSLLVVSATFAFLILQLGYTYQPNDINMIKWAFIIQGAVLLLICLNFGYYMHGRFWIKTDISGADPNYLSGWFILPISCCMEKIFDCKKIWGKILLIIEVIACFYYIFQTASRSGLITNTFLVILCVLYESRHLIKKYPIRAIIIICMMIFALGSAYSLLPDVTLSRIKGTSSLGSRGNIWRQLFEKFVINPIGLIFGFGHSSVQFYNYEHLASHNTFLETTFNYGLIGLFLLLSFITKGIKNCVKNNPFAVIAFIVMFIQVFTLTALTTRFFMLSMFYIGLINGSKQSE